MKARPWTTGSPDPAHAVAAGWATYLVSPGELVCVGVSVAAIGRAAPVGEAGFAHQRLDAFRVAMELAEGVVRLTRRLPRGFSDLRSQLQRSALATVRHIAEGASRVGPADKRARFTVARGEVAECDASLETLAALGLAPCTQIDALRQLADRAGAMLTGLVRRESRRMAEPGGKGRARTTRAVRPARGAQGPGT